ncbi:serine carboxypeptidase-like 18 [Pistacia vera]|uniref:serine carboxypeptidase-like 18 n=1 Tax=Pistacia vera TaxID=55513 RepID=UPI00126359CE|nr:serine carboxypeptidase-like 18 [Pistacia vera]
MAPSPSPSIFGHPSHRNLRLLTSFTDILKLVLYLILFLVPKQPVVSQSIIKNLPGFPGNLPFKLETGYVGMGYLEEVQLFYYFIESERSPKDDPLLLWLTGGPGCSALSALFYEIAKIMLLETLIIILQVANIIFLDALVGTGFSYAKTSEGYNIGDLTSASQTYEFLRKWLLDHPKFLSNPLYVSGDSYSGMTVPIIVQKMYNGIKEGDGYVLGNPFTDVKTDLNSRIIFAHKEGLLSKQLYESTKINCKGEYMRPDTNNSLCMGDLEVVNKCLEKIYMPQVLEPKCSTLTPKPIGHPSFLQGEHSMDVHLSTPQLLGQWCRNYNYLWSYIWANDQTVQKALNVREGTIKEWERCNSSFSSTYVHDIITSIDYQRNLTRITTYRALIYSGDHDMVIPYVGTQEWIESLGLSLSNDWEPWFVDGQTAGYNLMYSLKKYSLTYVTVKGAGHTAPEYRPKECLAMIDRWFAYYPL